MDKCKKKQKIIQRTDIEPNENIPNSETKYLLKFNDSYEKISNSKQIVKLATVERHRGLNTKYNKHILFLRRKLIRDVALQN